MVYEDYSDDLPGLPFQLMQVHAGPHKNFVYVIGPEGGGEAVVIDPAFELETLFDAAKARGLRITSALFTHGHWDHIGGIPAIFELGVRRIGIHEVAAGHPKVKEAEKAGADVHLLSEGDRLEWGGPMMHALYTPGHQPESTCYLAGRPDGPRALFGGDTLFIDSCGRTDFPGGDTDLMFVSMSRLRATPRPESVFVMPGHHYAKHAWRTLAQQVEENRALSVRDPELFEALPFLVD